MANRIMALGGVLALAMAGAAGYWFGTTEARSKTRITATACGIAGGEPPIDIPLHLFIQQNAELPIQIGPIEVPGAGPPVSIRFDPLHDGVRGRVFRVGGVIHLPPAFGRNRQLPEQITLGCRDGAVAVVSYRTGKQSTVFSVMHSPAAGK